MSDPTPAEIRIRVPIRWRDLDLLGHLNQAVYHELLEEGRAALVDKLGGEEEFAFVLARVELDYRNEVRRVRVRWRAQDVAGLALEPLDAHASLEDSGRMRALEQEVASLRRRNAELQPWG